MKAFATRSSMRLNAVLGQLGRALCFPLIAMLFSLPLLSGEAFAQTTSSSTPLPATQQAVLMSVIQTILLDDDSENGAVASTGSDQTSTASGNTGASGSGGTSTSSTTTTTTTPSSNGSVIYIHTDGLGSPVARTDASGNLISRTSYEPYGYVASGATPDIGFTGHVNDANTGLTYMQQRYYDPVAGRFLSIDPMVTDVNNANAFNRYVYASNNPYNRVDPDGRADCTVDANGCKHIGTPQKTSPGHDEASAKIGGAYSKQGATEVHYNRPLANVAGDPAAGQQRPDVAAVFPDKSISTTEVVSPSQTVASQVAKGEVMQSKLAAIGRDGTASTVTIAEGLSGVAVRSIGALSLLGPFVRAADINKIEQTHPGLEVATPAKVGYMFGVISREQLMRAIDETYL